MIEALEKFAYEVGTDHLSGPVTENTDLWVVVSSVVNVAMTVLGILSVVMLIVAGYMYTTSSGDANKVTKAKNTLLYGVIGLVIALLALAIVNFVLGALGGGGGGADA